MAEERKILHWIIVVLLSLIWGTSYILMKRGLESFTSLQIGSLRILITFLCLLPIALHNLHKLNRQNLNSILIIGFFGSGIPAYLFPIAQTRISSSLASMLNSLSPVFTLLVGVFFYKWRVITSQILGVLLGLIGAVELLYAGSFSFIFYGLFVILATLLYGINANEVSIVEGINGLQITSLAFLVISPMAAGFLLFSDFSHVASTEHWLRNLGCIILLAVMGTALAQALFYLLIRETSPVFASMITYFIPVISTLWGIADNESFAPSMLVSVVVILTGVYLINRTGLKKYIRSVNE
jgi:drug/metabolite transporter (DMT)-like permease